MSNADTYIYIHYAKADGKFRKRLTKVRDTATETIRVGAMSGDVMATVAHKDRPGLDGDWRMEFGMWEKEGANE